MTSAIDPKAEFIDAALWHGSLDRAEATLAAHPEIAGSDIAPALRLMLDLDFDAGSSRSQPKWSRGITALHEVAARGLLANAKLLIERGAPLDALNGRGHTPLAVAVLCLEQQSEWTPNDYTLPIAAALIDAGAKVELAKMTLAGAVCLGRAADIASLAASASPRDKQGALAAVAYNGLAKAIPMLIELGADPNAANAGLHPDAMALHNAVCSGSLDTVKALRLAGAKFDTQDSAHQGTPLDWAEYFVREKRDAVKQDTAIAAYLREWENLREKEKQG